jgi:anti-anti-sigma factor
MSTPLSPVTPVPRLDIETIRPSPTQAWVGVIGEVDLATSKQLRDTLLIVLHDRAPAVVDVDLAGVSFLDCAGIGALVAVRNVATGAGRQLRVSHPLPIVRRILELTGLLGVLTAPPDRPGQPPSKSDDRGSTKPAAASTQPSDLIMLPDLPGRR